MPRWRAVLLIVGLTTGCALQPDYIEVRRTPRVGISPMAGAEAVNVSVEARDGRQIRDRVSNKVNGYGMEMAPIIATNDILAEVRSAVVDELRGRGFQIGGLHGAVDIELLRFYSRFQVGFFTGAAAAEVSANVRVTAPGGRIVYARTYSADGINPDLLLASGENARIALVAGLDRLIRQIGEDTAFLQALTSLAPVPEAPAPAQRGRRPVS